MDFTPYEERVEAGYLRKVTKGDLVLYNYTDACTYAKAWDEFTLNSRGIIFNSITGEIVARPFPKFFNLGEHESTFLANLPNEEFVAYEKMDGSLGIIYYYDNEWHVATRGSFSSDQAIRGKQILLEQIQTRNLNPDYTYLAEIIYPENKIIVNYSGKEELCFLGAIDKETGQDVFPYLSPEMGFTFPKVYTGKSIEELIELKKSIPKDEEGWVLHYPGSGLRVKIKGDEYLKLAKILAHCSPLSFWEAMKDGFVRKDFLAQIPEEILPEFLPLVENLENKFWTLRSEINNKFIASRAAFAPDRKSAAQAINYCNFEHKGALFALLDNKQERLCDYIMKTIKPKGNVL